MPIRGAVLAMLGAFLCTPGCTDVTFDPMGMTDAAPADGPSLDGASIDAAPADAAVAPAFRVEKRGELVVAIRPSDTKETFSGTDFRTVLEQTLGALSAGRNSQETIAIQGVFVLTGTVKLPSYVRLDLADAEISLGNQVDQSMFKNSDPMAGNTAIFIYQGQLDGNIAQNRAPANYMVDEDDSHAMIYFSRVTDSAIEGTRFRNARSHSVYLYRSQRVAVRSIENVRSRFEGLMTWKGSDNTITGSTFSTLNSSGIATATSPRTIITDNTVEHVRRDHSAISLNSESSQVLRNRIDDGDGTGVTVGHLAPEFSASHSTIGHNVITRIAINGISMVNGNPNKDIRMHDNRIEDVTEGIAMAGGTASLGGVADIVAESNIIIGARSRGIRVTTGANLSLHRVTLRGNTISNGGVEGATNPELASGIVLVGDASTSYEEVIVTGNRVFDDRMVKLQLYGVTVRRTNSCTVTNNDLRGNAKGPILVGAGNTNLMVSGNQ